MKHSTRQGFTLIEALVVVALIAILLALAVPAFRDFMLIQRLKSINAQLVTDLQFARSEAVSRNTFLRVAFAQAEDHSMTCYSLYTTAVSTNGTPCNCLLGAGAACGVNASEVRTVQVPASLSVTIIAESLIPAPTPPDPPEPATASDTAFAFDPVTGGIFSIPTDQSRQPINEFVINTGTTSSRILKTTVGRAGRVTVCASTASLGAPACS